RLVWFAPEQFDDPRQENHWSVARPDHRVPDSLPEATPRGFGIEPVPELQVRMDQQRRLKRQRDKRNRVGCLQPRARAIGYKKAVEGCQKVAEMPDAYAECQP